MEIRPINTDQEYAEVYPVLRELRSTPTLENVLELSREAEKRDQFQLVAAFDGDVCLGVMGYRVLYDLTHFKHLYVDDLVVTEKMRSKNVGRALISYAENKAYELNCSALRLCTGTDNLNAQKFYERLGWSKKSYAFKKYLKP